MLRGQYINKIHIIGGAGSGKTTLAVWLADALGCPHYDLDRVGWSVDGKVPLDQRLEKIARILENPCWITEGMFLWWIDPLLEAAYEIVWLDLPFPLTAWRMVKRHIRADLRGDNPHPGYKHLFEFVTGVAKRHYRRTPIEPAGPDDDFAVTRAATAQVLRDYNEKLVHCRRTRDVEVFKARSIS